MKHTTILHTVIGLSLINILLAQEKLEQLDDERMKQEQAHTKLEKEFRDYQRKYQIK